MTPDQLVQQFAWLLPLIAVWDITWKGFALWKAAHRNRVAWFVALLLLNTIGIFPIIYIFVIDKYLSRKQQKTEEHTSGNTPISPPPTKQK